MHNSRTNRRDFLQAGAAGIAAVGADHPQLAAMHAAIGELLLSGGDGAAAADSAETALRLLAAEDSDAALRVRAWLTLAAVRSGAARADALAQARAALPAVAEPDVRVALAARLAPGAGSP